MSTAVPTTGNRSCTAARVATTMLVVLIGWGTACDRSEPAESQAEGIDTADATASDVSPGENNPERGLQLGDWEAYPALAEDAEWPDEPLDAERWARVSAELACAGRKNRGDPDSQRQRVRNIIGHHRTTLIAVAEWSTRFNRDQPEQARRWALPISNAVKGCR